MQSPGGSFMPNERPPSYERLPDRVDDRELAHALANVAEFVRATYAAGRFPARRWTDADRARYWALCDAVRAARC